MAHINWDRPFAIDPTTGESVPIGTPGSVLAPTYGHYGGANFSANAFGGALITDAGGNPLSQPALLAAGNADQDPVDDLDYRSYVHDVRSSHTGSVYNLAQAQADAELLNSVVALNSHTDPEMALYAGATSLGMIGSLALHGFLNVLSPVQLIAGFVDAVRDIDFGLDNLPDAEQALALNFFFTPSDPGVYVYEFALTTTSFRQELAELAAMNVVNAVLDRGESDDAPLNTGFPFPGTSYYQLAYNAITGDLDLNSA